jgi:hypothetical protein
MHIVFGITVLAAMFFTPVAGAEAPAETMSVSLASEVASVTCRSRCDVLEITATTGREVAKSTSSCSVTLATANFRYRPKADGDKTSSAPASCVQLCALVKDRTERV